MLEFQGGIVKVIQGCEKIPALEKLFNSDKTIGKKWFNECITYVFHVYSNDYNAPYRNYFPEEKKQKVCETYFSNRKPSDFETNYRVADFIRQYLEGTFTLKERMHISIHKDIEKKLQEIEQIPSVKKGKVKFKFDMRPYGVEEDITVDAEVDIDNMEERLRAMEALQKYMQFEEKLKLSIEKEEAEKSKKKGTRSQNLSIIEKMQKDKK